LKKVCQHGCLPIPGRAYPIRLKRLIVSMTGLRVKAFYAQVQAVAWQIGRERRQTSGSMSARLRSAVLSVAPWKSPAAPSPLEFARIEPTTTAEFSYRGRVTDAVLRLPYVDCGGLPQ